VVQPSTHVEADLETHVGPAPTGPAPKAEPQPTIEAKPAPALEQDVDVDVDVDVPPLAPLGEVDHTPPHAPPGPSPATVEEVGPEGPTSTKPSDEPELAAKPDANKPSTARTVFLLFGLVLLLALGGLMVWSLVTTGDPLKMIMELTGIEQPAPAAPAPDAAPADKAAPPPAQPSR
jgi:hypothetical protein